MGRLWLLCAIFINFDGDLRVVGGESWVVQQGNAITGDRAPSVDVETAARPATPRNDANATLTTMSDRKFLLVAGLATLYAALAGIWLVVALAQVVETKNADYFLLLESARQLDVGESLYERPSVSMIRPGVEALNLNHPAVVVAMLPLAPLSDGVGLVVWTLAGLAAGVGALFVARSQMRSPPKGRAAVLVGLLAFTFAGTIYSLQIGQLGLLLAFAITAVWALVRRERWLLGGLLLGGLIMVKVFFLPLLLVFLLKRAWSGLAMVAVGGVGLSLLALPVAGADAFVEWVTTLAQVDWHEFAMNISLPGLLHRVIPGASRVATLATTLTVVTIAAAACLRRPAAGMPSVDRNFALLLVAALLASPLGWLYYTPLMLPVAVTLWNAQPSAPPRRQTALKASAALLWVPYIVPALVPETSIGALGGAVHTYGLVILAGATAGLFEAQWRPRRVAVAVRDVAPIP